MELPERMTPEPSAEREGDMITELRTLWTSYWDQVPDNAAQDPHWVLTGCILDLADRLAGELWRQQTTRTQEH